MGLNGKGIFLGVLLFITYAQAHEKIEHLQVKEVGQGIRLEFRVTYLNPWGHTTADSQGLHYYHDYLSSLWGINPPLVSSESKILPSQYWRSDYPLYYAGQTMNYQITLTNTGHKKFKRITVVAIQEYLNPNGEIGARIGPDAVRDWFIPQLENRQAITLEGSINIPSSDIESGLDQTHIQVFRSKKEERGENGNEGVVEEEREEALHHHHGHEQGSKTERLIFEDIQAGIWCPPQAQPKQP